MRAVQKDGNSSLYRQVTDSKGVVKARPNSFQKRSHLRKADEISSVFDFKCRQASQHFVVQGKPNGLLFPRLAIMVAKKTARLSVSRNYIKRIVREKFRSDRGQLGSIDIVVRVVKTFNQQEFASIMQELSVTFVKIRKCQNS